MITQKTWESNTQKNKNSTESDNINIEHLGPIAMKRLAKIISIAKPKTRYFPPHTDK